MSLISQGVQLTRLGGCASLSNGASLLVMAFWKLLRERQRLGKPGVARMGGYSPATRAEGDVSNGGPSFYGCHSWQPPCSALCRPKFSRLFSFSRCLYSFYILPRWGQALSINFLIFLEAARWTARRGRRFGAARRRHLCTPVHSKFLYELQNMNNYLVILEIVW